MRDNIKLSVIIPLFNKEKYIKQTIESVINQDYHCFEVIVVDDGSTDNSLGVVNEIKDERISVIRQCNSGVSAARNNGAKSSNTDWLIFLDGDDVFMQGTLRKFADLILHYPNDDVFVANYVSSEHIKNGAFSGQRERIYEKPLKALWRREFYPHPGNIVCSKRAFFSIGGFDERMSYYEDFVFGVRLIKNYRVVYTPFVCMEYVVEHNEARVKLHSLEKEYSYYIESESLENKWLKNFCYTLYKGFISKRHAGGDVEGTKILQNIRDKKFGRNYILVDFFYRVRRKILKYGI